MGEILIRKAKADDISNMQDIARRTIDGKYRSFLGDEGVDWFINSGESDREIQSHLDNCHVLLKEDAIVAFTILFEDLIHLMMVDVSLHRRGIGSKLLAYAENALFDRGNKTIRLETFEGNQQAISFYIKNGWSLIKRLEDKEHGFIRVFFEKKA